GTDDEGGPEVDLSFLLEKEVERSVEKEQSFVPNEVEPTCTEVVLSPLVDVGPDGPHATHWNPFVDNEQQLAVGQLFNQAINNG
ncbi:hypothetical protein A2U01_0021153, partial [Trifolium medium]|nr:hypothetical protein [Trifolium medium]